MVDLDPTTTPRQDRENRRATIARALARAMAEVGSSQRLVAAQIGVSDSRLQQWLDPASATSIPLADVLALPPLVRRALADLIAESLGLTLAEPELEAEPPAIAALHHGISGSTINVLDVLQQATHAGALGPENGEELERHSGLLEARARQAKELGRRAQLERVVPIRRSAR